MPQPFFVDVWTFSSGNAAKRQRYDCASTDDAEVRLRQCTEFPGTTRAVICKRGIGRNHSVLKVWQAPIDKKDATFDEESDDDNVCDDEIEDGAYDEGFENGYSDGYWDGFKDAYDRAEEEAESKYAIRRKSAFIEKSDNNSVCPDIPICINIFDGRTEHPNGDVRRHKNRDCDCNCDRCEENCFVTLEEKKDVCGCPCCREDRGE